MFSRHYSYFLLFDDVTMHSDNFKCKTVTSLVMMTAVPSTFYASNHLLII